MMTPEVAAMRIGPTLIDSENDLDSLIANLGGMIAKMTTTRRELGEPAIWDQRAIKHVLGASAKLAEARGELVLAHAAMFKQYQDLKAPETEVTADFPTQCPCAGTSTLEDSDQIAA